MGAKFEDSVVVSGIGQSAVGRRLGRSPLDLTLDAVGAAIADAGLTPAEVRGVATYPGGGVALGAGFAGPPAAEVADALGLEPDYLVGGFEGPAQLGPLVHGALAVHAGLARHLVVYRTVTEGSARATAPSGAPGPPGRAPWITAAGDGPAPVAWATIARRHFAEFGTTREQLAQIALTDRANAAHNPQAVYRDPLTLDEYLAARMIADPLCLYDCDVHCDASTAVVLSHVDTVPDLASSPVHLEAVGVAPAPRADWSQLPELLPGARAAAQLWSRTGLRPHDVDVAGLYDGFSIQTLLWLEALGFCGRGESGAFVDGGARIARDGELPLNPHGGQLSGGRTHGLGFVHEICLQLRGGAGERQVGAAQVGVVAVGATPYVGCLVLRSDR